MRCLLILLLVSSSLIRGYTVSTDFLRLAKVYKRANFPLDVTFELPNARELTFRINLLKAATENGKIIRARIDRILADEHMGSFEGDFELGKKVPVVFQKQTPDGETTVVGPRVCFSLDD